MADVINLRQKRKQKKRSEQEKQAAQNRVKFGRTKEQKRLEEFETRKAEKKLDDAQRDSEE